MIKVKYYLHALFNVSVKEYSSKAWMSSRTKIRLLFAYGLTAGFVSSIAISGLLLLVEKSVSLPVGTFYIMLSSAFVQSHGYYSIDNIIFGFALHLITGSVIGLVMCTPFIVLKGKSLGSLQKYAVGYGLGFGFALWSFFFIPITLWIILPILDASQDKTIIQEVPAQVDVMFSTDKLAILLDRIMIGAIAFNMFYGLLVAIMIKSLFEYRLKKESAP
jgi:hypothetical protein